MPPIVKRDQVRFDPDATARPAGQRSCANARGKQARLVRVEGIVRAIEFTCACGEVSLLELEFDPASAKPQSPPRA
jgi:hypothetical protein